MRSLMVVMVAALVALPACSEDGTNDTSSGGPGGSASTSSSGGGGASSSSSTSSGGSTTTGNFSCSNAPAEWLLCEDFETGAGDFDVWLAASDFIGGPGDDDRGRVDISSEYTRSGSHALYMPAEAGSGYQGSGMDWWACDGDQVSGCNSLRSYDQLYFRAWVRFAEDHRYIHHFLSIGGSQPDDFWYHGTAGCLPNGSLAMGTTVDSRPDSHESFFYTYTPDMNCDTNCSNYADVNAICQECAGKGLPTCTQQPQCCWGNNYSPPTAHSFPVGQWFCFEMTMAANTVGSSDGSMAYSVDGELIHQENGMMWRTSPTLALNRARVQHYITTDDADGHSNRVWFDDVVVSTAPIGCD